MKFQPGFTDFFMSPVTGRLGGYWQFPDLLDDYIIIGGWDDRPMESPALIDLKLEIVDLRNRLSETHFILQHPSPHFDNSQALDQLIPGLLRQDDGVVSIATLSPGNLWIGDDFGYPSEIVILPLANMANLPENNFWLGDSSNRPVPTSMFPIGSLPDLPYHNIWIGDVTNRPVAQGRIWDDGVGDGNLPAYTSDQFKMIWRMNSDGIPILVNDLTDLESGVTTIVGEIADIFGSLSRLFSSVASLVSSVNSILSTISTILGQIDSILSNIASIFSSIDSILSSIASILDTISGMEITIEIIEEEIITIDGEITDIYSELSTIEGEIITIEGEIATINDTLVTIEGEITVINDTLATIEGEIATINSTLATIEGEITEIFADIATIEGEILTIEGEITTIEGEIATIEAEIITIEGEIATLTADVATLDATVATLVTEVADLETRVTALEVEFEALYDAIAVINTEVDIIQDQILALEAWEAIQTEKMAEAEDNITTLFGLVSDPITLTGDVTGVGYLNVPIATTLTLTLDQIPLAAANVNLNGYQINNLAMASVPAGTDAVNVDYLSSFVGGGTVILTGDVTGSGLVNDGGFATTLTLTLDQILAPVNNVNMNSYEITNIADPTSAQSAATQNYVQTYVDSIVGDGSITLTGDVTGSGTTGTPFATTLALHLDQIPLAAANVNINSHKLINVTDPTSAQDAATRHFVDNSTTILTGDVTGSGHVNDGGFATTLALHLQQIPLATGNLNLNTHQINNLAMAGSPASTDATNVSYVNSQISGGTVILTGDITGSGHVNDGGFATTLTLHLNQIPTATGNVDLNSHKLINVTDPSSAQDAATRHYVDNSTVTLTGDVTGSGDVNSSFATTLTLTLDQILAPTGNVDMNGYKIINMDDPTNPQDAATKGYADSLSGYAGTIDFSGAVIGSGNVGTPFTTTLNSTVNTTSGGQTFSFPSSSSAAAFTLLSNFTPVTLTPSNVELTLQNSIGSGFHSLLTSSTGAQTYPDGIFKFYAFTASTSTEIYKCDSTLFTFDIPVTINNVLSMASNQIHNLAMAGSPAGTDAVNVNYLNSQIAAGTVILTGAVTGSGHVNDGGFTTTLATTVNINGATEIFSFAASHQVSNLTLLTNYVPTMGNDSFLQLGFQNSVGGGYFFQLDTKTTGGDGTVGLYTSGGSGLFSSDGSTFQFDIPIVMHSSNIDMNSNQINNLVMAGSPAGTDAVNVDYLVSYVPTVVDAGIVILTGAVSGSGFINDGGFATTLNNTIDVNGSEQTFSFPSSDNVTGLILQSNYTTTTGHGAYLNIILQNAAGNGYFWEVEYTDAGGIYPNGKLTLFSETPGPTYNALYTTDGSTFEFAIPVSITDTLDMNTTTINNIGNFVSSTNQNNFVWSDQSVELRLNNTYTPTLGNNSFLYFTMVNQISAGYYWKLESTYSGGTDPNGTLSLFDYRSSGTIQNPLWSTDGSTHYNYIPLDMQSHQIHNVTDPSSSQDACTKNYYDSRVACGEIYTLSDGATISITASTTSAIDVTGFTSTQDLVNFSCPSTNKLKYTGTPTVNVHCVANMGFSYSVNTSLYITILKNGSQVAGFTGPIDIISGTNYLIGCSLISSTATNDYYSIAIFANNTGTLTVNRVVLSGSSI